jgi:hypothetical protein
MPQRILPVLVGILCLVGPHARLQAANLPVVPAPPPPANYQAVIRYQIIAFRAERLRQYAEMTRYLDAIGFRRDEADKSDTEADDPRHTRMKGILPSRAVSRLLIQRHVRTVLLLPQGEKVPEPAVRVRVDLQLASGLAPKQQQLLARQTAEVLSTLGFQEAIGYDHREYTRLLGSIPAAQVNTLLEDLRKTPAGAKQPAPFSSLTPIQVVLVQPGILLPRPRPAAQKVPRGQDKFSPELRNLLADPGRAGKPTRLEVILGYTPAESDSDWRRLLAGKGLIVEGRLGPLVTGVGIPRTVAADLAGLPEVVAIRLPVVAQPSRPTGREDVVERWEPVKASGLARLHALGCRGKGTRLAIVAGDFHGWEKLKDRKVGKGLLPDPVLVDLTRERNVDLLPDPFPSADKDRPFGPGTLAALAILRAAPEVELTLIRIDPAAPYMLQTAARAINGETVRSLALQQRVRDLAEERSRLDVRRDELLEERRMVLDDLRDEDEPRKRREEYFRKQAAFDKQLDAHRDRVQRIFLLQRQLKALKGIRVVANSLVWSEGHPVDGSSALSRYFDDCPFRAALWFQAAGDTRGQAWTGMFRDADENGVMEFAAAEQRLPAGSWTRELNFLAWQPLHGKVVRDLPAKTRVRLTLQWREAHDPLPWKTGEDLYRQPLAQLRLVVLYQPDPSGTKRPADDLEFVTESVGIPQRLNHTGNAGTYEQVVEFVVPRAGRYTVRIEGRAPTGIQAPGEASLPALRKASELKPRLFVQTLDGTGRVVLIDFATDAGTVGVPGDARRVITVGAASAGGNRQPFSAGGPPYNLALLCKPEVLAYDEGLGTGQAASFAAGLAATSLTAGASHKKWLEAMGVRSGELLRIPQRRH